MDAALSQDVLLDHFKNPRHRGAVPAPVLSGQGVNPACGDRVSVTGTWNGGRLLMKIEGTGCVISQASASMMAQALQGRGPDEAKALARAVRGWISGGERPAMEGEGAEDLEALSGVRRHPSRVKCACLAWTVFLDSLEGR
jgi:nitrogen fixation NifU-like protein